MKEWFILVKQKEEGPYSVKQLRYHPDVTPDTYARKIGWSAWKKIKEISELKEIFEDSYTNEEEEAKQKKNRVHGKEELAINPIEPNRFLFWLTLAVLVIIILYLYAIFNKNG